MKEIYKLGLDRKPLQSNLSKGCWGLLLPPPPGECVVLEDGSSQSRLCVGAVRGGAACGRAGFDTEDEKDMV
jgi:hypothetical protein